MRIWKLKSYYPAEAAGLDVVKRLRDNVQKLQKFERVDLLDQGSMKRICLILSSCMGDLGWRGAENIRKQGRGR